MSADHLKESIERLKTGNLWGAMCTDVVGMVRNSVHFIPCNEL
jgi:hypothetical protein